MAAMNWWARGPGSSNTTAVGAGPPLRASRISRNRRLTGIRTPISVNGICVKARRKSLTNIARPARSSRQTTMSVAHLATGQLKENIIEVGEPLGDAQELGRGGHCCHHLAGHIG